MRLIDARLAIALMIGGISLATFSAAAQTAPSSADELPPIRTSGSSVGYIDSALPETQFRFRYDTSYNNERPNRAEFFWPKGAGAGGPGAPLAERAVDYQDISSYLEFAWTDFTSLFVELPVRFLNPDRNDNTSGLGDMNLGFKQLLWIDDDSAFTFQFRTYLPTGDADRGLGNDHVSLEPALLYLRRLDDFWTFEAELRDWIPIDGTDFAGNVIRYGVGISYHGWSIFGFEVAPVAEFVGWTVLDGKESILRKGAVLALGSGGGGQQPNGKGPPPPPPSAFTSVVRDAGGDTIINAKIGLRTQLSDSSEFYFGYGRSLTGDVWYENTWRFELRFYF